jgi:hypothetical protein
VVSATLPTTVSRAIAFAVSKERGTTIPPASILAPD